jgi:hypothetical protein
MGDSAHTTHHTNPGKKSATPLFPKDENIFQKSASLVQWDLNSPLYHASHDASQFLKNVLIFEKKGGR